MIPTEMIARYAAKLSAEAGTPITPADAEAEILAVLMEVARRSASRGIAYYDPDDVVQYLVLEGLKLLAKGKYDPERPLAAYFFAHVKRRLQNLRRDLLIRPEAPCRCCDPFNPPAEPCGRWHRWHERNFAKQALAGPGVSSDHVEVADHKSTPAAELVGEIVRWVDATWPADLRADFLRMQRGVAIPKARRARVREAVLDRFGEEAHLDAA